MEIVRTNILVPESNCSVVPTYDILKTMSTIDVTDRLGVLFNDGMGVSTGGYSLVPIKRHPITHDSPDFPRRVMIDITSRCNKKCPMCKSSSISRPRADMPLDMIKSLIDEVNDFGNVGLWLYNAGEPLLHRDFLKIIEHINKKHKLGSIWISTNMQLMTEEIGKVLIESNLSFLNVSVNADSPETFDGNWEKMIESLYYLLSFGCGPIIRVQAIDNGINVDKFILTFKDKSDMLSVNWLEIYPGKETPLRPIGRCSRVSLGCASILSNGDISMCSSDYNGIMLIGNAKNGIREVWNSPRRKQITSLNEIGQLGLCQPCASCANKKDN